MASENSQITGTTTPSNLEDSLANDPNFATICSFIEKFGELCHIGIISFTQLQEMLEDTTDVPIPLVQLHIRLLRRVFKSINTSKWEKSVSKFAHMYNSQDGWEVERFGYKKSKIQTKLRILKNLLESQFDYNPKFKGEVNKLPAADLRLVPLGRDEQGHCYWYQVDNLEANLRVYREDVEGETWEIVASTREEMDQLIMQLKSGEIRKANSVIDEETIEEDEDVNGLTEVEILKDILLDTGKLLDEEDVDMASGLSSELSDDSNSLAISFDNVEEVNDHLEHKNSQPESSTLPSTLIESNNLNTTQNENLGIFESSSKSKINEEEFRDSIVNTPVVPESILEGISSTESSTKCTDQNIIIHSSESVINSAIQFDVQKGDGEDDIVKVERDIDDKLVVNNLVNEQENALRTHTNMRDNSQVSTMVELSEIKTEPNSVDTNTKVEFNNSNSELKCFLEPIEKVVDDKNEVDKRSVHDQKYGVDDLVKIERDIDDKLNTNKLVNEQKTELKIITQMRDDSQVSAMIEPSEIKAELKSVDSNTKMEIKEPNLKCISEPKEQVIVDDKNEGEKVSTFKLPENNTTIQEIPEHETITKEISDNKTTTEEIPENIITTPDTPKNKTTTQETQLQDINNATLINQDTELSIATSETDTTVLVATPTTDIPNSLDSSESLQISHNNEDTVLTTTQSSQEANVENNICAITTLKETTTEVDDGTNNHASSDSVQKSSESNDQAALVKANPLGGLVGYDCSSSDEEDDESEATTESNKNTVPVSSSLIEKKEDDEKVLNKQPVLLDTHAPVESDKSKGAEIVNATDKVEIISSGQKRKLEEEPDSTSDEQQIKSRKISDNPIVGETIEEDVFFVTGTGEGALNEGGNETPSPTINDTLVPPSSEILQGEQLNSSVVSTGDSDKNTPPAKNKGRGRPRKNPPKEVLKDKNISPSSTASPDTKHSRRNSFNDEVNGVSSFSSVRRSGRVAQIRQKEEEERRKLEEERLAQLKDAQLRKKQKQLERELKAARGEGGPPKPPKVPKTPKPAKVAKAGAKQVAYIPPSSEDDSDTEEEAEDEGDEYDGPGATKPGKKKRKKRAKNGKGLKRGANPWCHSSSEDDEAVEEEEEHYEEEEEEEELVFNNKSDHEFSPESDLEDTEFSPSRHARTAKQKEQAVDKYAETYCEKCAKGDHPEWILLCDSCDKGWHASCVYPQLWVIPEGVWFCPPCQHRMLIEKLSENLVEFDKILKKKDNEMLRKQRLAYVGISLNNVLPSAEKPADKSDEDENGEHEHRRRRPRHRRIYSDEELEDFINDNDDDDKSSSGSGSQYESEDEPYQLRARRATKSFSFKEYDEMINTALGDDSADDQEEPDKLAGEPGSEIPASETNDEEGMPPIKVVESGGKRMPDEDSSEEEDLDEKEKNRRKILNQSQRKSRRRLNDLDATSEEDSDEDFKGSGGSGEDEDEEDVVEEDSEWSGDESDDSIAVAKLSRKKKRRRGPLGRQEKYLDDGETVRRSTRRRKSRVIYDESDQDEDEDDQTEKWQSGESENSEDESDSESDDETWGKKKKQKKQSSGTKLPNFFTGGSGPFTKPKKKKKRRVDDDDVDRAWTNKFGSKVKKLSEEPVERKTRGRQINFKDILDSGESDDDGNIRPKRRRILSDDDSDDEMPGSSRKLVEEIKAANAKAAAEEKEKLREIAEANKKLENEHVVAVKSLPIIADLPTVIPDLEKVEERPIKITNSIVESILMRKTPDIESPVTTPPPIPSINEEPYLPTSVMPGPLIGVPSYLATVLGSGSARVGKNLGKKLSGSMMPTAVSQSGDVLPFPSSSSKKSSVSIPVPPKSLAGALASSSSPILPSSSSIPRSILPPNIPSELTRIASPMYANNPALIRSFTPWGIGRSPPPYAGPPLGKPPPLNSSSFMPQPGQLRPPPTSYSSTPPALRIPNPNSLQAFQQFSKRSSVDVGGPHYRMPGPHQLPPSSVLPSMTRERIFLGGSSPYAPYGMIPQSQHPALFAPPPFDYRAAESFKEELLERHQHPPTTLSSAHSLSQLMKDDMHHPPTQGDGEFGGLVSYFSSQHSNDED